MLSLNGMVTEKYDGTQQKIRKMNKNEQQMYKDISDLTKAVQKLVKLIEKMAKQQL